MNKDLIEIINQALDERGISARKASILATGTPELVRDMRRGRVPSVARFRALCDVLNLEFYVGPTRPDKADALSPSEERAVVYQMFDEIISRLPAKDTTGKMAEPRADYETSKTDDTYHIPVFKLAADTKHKQVVSHIAFQLSWLKAHQLDPRQCCVLHVDDPAMEPTLPRGSVVLIDRSCRRRIGRIYAIRTAGAVLVRRLGKDKNQWQLISDHPQWKTISLPATAEIIGEVKWMSKILD